MRVIFLLALCFSIKHPCPSCSSLAGLAVAFSLLILPSFLVCDPHVRRLSFSLGFLVACSSFASFCRSHSHHVFLICCLSWVTRGLPALAWASHLQLLVIRLLLYMPESQERVSGIQRAAWLLNQQPAAVNTQYCESSVNQASMSSIAYQARLVRYMQQERFPYRQVENLSLARVGA